MDFCGTDVPERVADCCFGHTVLGHLPSERTFYGGGLYLVSLHNLLLKVHPLCGKNYSRQI